MYIVCVRDKDCNLKYLTTLLKEAKNTWKSKYLKERGMPLHNQRVWELSQPCPKGWDQTAAHTADSRQCGQVQGPNCGRACSIQTLYHYWQWTDFKPCKSASCEHGRLDAYLIDVCNIGEMMSCTITNEVTASNFLARVSCCICGSSRHENTQSLCQLDLHVSWMYRTDFPERDTASGLDA